MKMLRILMVWNMICIILLISCNTNGCKEVCDQSPVDTISEKDMLANKCIVNKDSSAIILKKYELVHDGIKKEIQNNTIDSLKLEGTNVLIMKIMKINDCPMISFFPSNINNGLTIYNTSIDEILGYFNIKEYEIIVKCPPTVSLNDINCLFRKSTGRKQFVIKKHL